MPHKPVLTKELLECLDLAPGRIVVDGTLGGAGHSLAILKTIGPKGKLIGIDQDPQAIARSRERLTDFQEQISLHAENFRNLDKVLERLNLPAVDAVILDVGFSSDQIEDSQRGFSFERAGPLDMRMNPEMPFPASDFLRKLPEAELEKLFREGGEERWSRRIAQAICEQRRRGPIETTEALVRVVEGALPRAYSAPPGRRPTWARHHPATRIFQALRIAVNDELGALREGLPALWKKLRPGGRLAVITFHSLEDRVVKTQFRSWVQAGGAKLVTRKPITARREEVEENSRARSAKLRAVEKCP